MHGIQKNGFKVVVIYCNLGRYISVKDPEKEKYYVSACFYFANQGKFRE